MPGSYLASFALSPITNLTYHFRLYLNADYSVRCGVVVGTGEDTDLTYKRIKSLAYGYVIVWPVGVPALLAVFLGCCRQDIIKPPEAKHTPLTRATRFLTEDYRRGAFYWELVDLLRKLFLTGFLLVLVPQHLSLLRLVLALLLSIGYLALLGVAQPYKRRSTGFLNIGLQLSLCFFLTAAMLIKVMPLVISIDPLVSSDAKRSSVFGWSSAFPLTVVILCLNFGVCGMALLVFLHKVRMPPKPSPPQPPNTDQAPAPNVEDSVSGQDRESRTRNATERSTVSVDSLEDQQHTPNPEDTFRKLAEGFDNARGCSIS